MHHTMAAIVSYRRASILFIDQNDLKHIIDMMDLPTEFKELSIIHNQHLARHNFGSLFVSLSVVCIPLNQTRDTPKDSSDEQITELILWALIRFYKLADIWGISFIYFPQNGYIYTSQNGSVAPFAELVFLRHIMMQFEF